MPGTQDSIHLDFVHTFYDVALALFNLNIVLQVTSVLEEIFIHIPKSTQKEFHLICKETPTVPSNAMCTELDLGAAHGHSVHLGILASEVYEAAPLLEHVWCNLDRRHHHHHNF